jgi:hypothetical protein
MAEGNTGSRVDVTGRTPCSVHSPLCLPTIMDRQIRLAYKVERLCQYHDGYFIERDPGDGVSDECRIRNWKDSTVCRVEIVLEPGSKTAKMRLDHLAREADRIQIRVDLLRGKRTRAMSGVTVCTFNGHVEAVFSIPSQESPDGKITIRDLTEGFSHFR